MFTGKTVSPDFKGNHLMGVVHWDINKLRTLFAGFVVMNKVKEKNLQKGQKQTLIYSELSTEEKSLAKGLSFPVSENAKLTFTSL